MTAGLFNDKMSSMEARTVFFKSIEGKSKSEIEQILNDYSSVNSIILHREFGLVSKGTITE